MSVAVFASVISAARISVQMDPNVNKLRMLHGASWTVANDKSDNKNNVFANLQWLGFTSPAWTS
jgi:hypothetical protein